MALLEFEVMLLDSRSELDLLQLHPVLLLASVPGFALLLVTKLAVIHDPADGWPREGSYLYKVEPPFFCHLQGLLNRKDAELLTLGVDDSNRADPDLLVYTRSLVYGRRSPEGVIKKGPQSAGLKIMAYAPLPAIRKRRDHNS